MAVGLWEAATGRLIRSWPSPGDSRGVACVAWSPDGKALVSAGSGGVACWDPESGKSIRTLVAYDLNAVAYVPDGSSVIAGGSKAVHVWNSVSGREAWVFKNPKTTVYSYAVAVSSDGKRLVSGGSGALCLWDLPR